MNKKIIKLLALESYTGREIDPKKVDVIVSKLSRTELKQYIKYLKELGKQKTVTIVTPIDLPDKDKQKLEELYRDKKVVFVKDSTLLVGIKIVSNDVITDYNLKSKLENLKEHAATI